MNDPIVALEIGTCRTVALVGERCEDDGIRITGCGMVPTLGVCKGVVTDVSHAATSVRKAIVQAQETGDLTINTVILGISGPGIRTAVHTGNWTINARSPQITRDDIEEVRDAAANFPFDETRETLLHTLLQHYKVDDQPFIRNPEGMRGHKLALDALAITAQANAAENFNAVARQAGLTVGNVVFSGAADAAAALTVEQKEAGVGLINFGGGKIDYVVFCGGVMVAAGCLGVGGEHITSDIMRAFTLTHAGAEELKRACASAIVQPDAGQRRETIRSTTTFSKQERTVSVKAVQTVTSARIDETLKVIRSLLNQEDVLSHLGAGLVFTGGCTAIPGLLELAQRIFGLPCRVGTPVNIADWEIPVEHPSALTTAAGLVLLAARERAAQEQAPSLLQRLLGRFG